MLNVLGMESSLLREQCLIWGQKAFYANSIMRWVHQRGVSDFAEMTDLNKVFREKLKRESIVSGLSLLQEERAIDGTIKWLLSLGGSEAIETVFIPDSDRGTLCVSTQVGCLVNCPFCQTGRQGFARNLFAHEIVGQLWFAKHALGDYAFHGDAFDHRSIDNIVFMGMGEPLHNYSAVVCAARIFLDDSAYGLSRRRVTVSTSGVVPMIDRLRGDCPVALAVSLHAANDELRNQLVPINRKYPLRELMNACSAYLAVAPRKFITFEYVMLEDINDRNEHLSQLLACVSGIPCKFNLIPFNSVQGSGFRCSTSDRIQKFVDELRKAGIVVTVRRTRGEDIDAACGQLAGSVHSRIKRSVPHSPSAESTVRLLTSNPKRLEDSFSGS